MKKFPNGFSCWAETHFQIVTAIALNEEAPTITDIVRRQGSGGLWELSESLTDEFEATYEGATWEDGDWYDTMDNFITEKLLS